MPSLPSLGPRPGKESARRGAAPLPQIRVPAERAVVDCAVYHEGDRRAGRCTYSAALEHVRSCGSGFVWLGLHEPDQTQMTSVAHTFGLHELMVEDAVHAHQRPKLERYDDVLFLVLRTVGYVEHESVTTTSEIVETGEIMIFVGRDFVVTVRHGDQTPLAVVRQLLEANPERLALGPTSVLYGIADHVVDSYLAVTGQIRDDVEDMEEFVFTPRSRVEVEQIYLLKREVMEMRRAVVPLADPLGRLTGDKDLPVPKEIRRYFRDVADHHTSVVDHIDSFDESLATLIDAAVAKITVQQNTDMRKISAWVAIAAVPTMVAGIYGMNFDNMPELHWQYGYPMVLVVLVSVVVSLYALFRHNRWL